MDFSIKTSLLWMLTIFTLNSKASETIHIPAICHPSNLQLRVVNATSELQRFDIQKRIDSEFQSQSFDISAQSQVQIKGSDLFSSPQPFRIRSWNTNSLEFSVVCDQTTSFTLRPITSPTVTQKLPSKSKKIVVHLLNLHFTTNRTRLVAYNTFGKLIAEKKIVQNKYYDTHTLEWKLPEEAHSIDIQAEGRLASIAASVDHLPNQFSLTEVKNPSSFQIDKTKTYFLISSQSKPPEDSYVISLSDPKMIFKARDQLLKGTFEKIIVGRISQGHHNVNRNFSSVDKSPYSWSVSQVDAFSDFAHIDCDGSPENVEENLELKLSEGGRICFWRYRVVRELTPLEVASGVLNHSSLPIP